MKKTRQTLCFFATTQKRGDTFACASKMGRNEQNARQKHRKTNKKIGTRKRDFRSVLSILFFPWGLLPAKTEKKEKKEGWCVWEKEGGITGFYRGSQWSEGPGKKGWVGMVSESGKKNKVGTAPNRDGVWCGGPERGKRKRGPL